MKPLAIITGGTSGIGLAIAREIAADHDLLLVYRSRHEQAGLALKEFKTKVEILSCDLRDHGAAKVITEFAAAKFGRAATCLVNSAGQPHKSLFMQTDPLVLEELFDTHVLGMMRLTQLCLVDMYRQRAGRILNISSLATTRRNRGITGYAAAKAAVEAFTKSLSLEVFHRGITVNAIRPGIVRTPMTEELLAANENAEVDAIPASSVGALAKFLLSPQAAHVNGAIVDIGAAVNDTMSSAADHFTKAPK